MKKVSVILTTYNGEKVINQTIKSIINQEGINDKFGLELIVVDDCSKDKTLELLKNYPCKVLSTRINSGGPNKGRNMGLFVATGDYLCIADQDDVWANDKILSVLPFLKTVPIVSSGYTLIDSSKGKKIERVKNVERKFLYYPKNKTFITRLTKSLSGQNTYLGSLIYSNTLQDIRFEEKFGVVDFDWIVRLFHQQDSIEVCKSLYTRYVDGSNLSLDETYRNNDFIYSLEFIETYRSVYPKEVTKSYKRLHGSFARYYYLLGEMNKARYYFRKAECNIKTILYYVTSFVGSSWVKRKFNVFG